MIELDDLLIELKSLKAPLDELKSSLNFDAKEKRVVELDRLMQEPDFWNDPTKANKLAKELKDLKDDMVDFNTLVASYEDLEAMIELANESEDKSLVPEIKSSFKDFKKILEEKRTRLLLSGEYDSMNAILRLNAGSGGTESCDWCGMLYRMYKRWAEKQGYKFSLIDYLPEEEAGIKSVTFQIDGPYAYGYLRSENGIHRLVRISPFNAQNKRQTSFVSCDVMPDINVDINIEIKDEDIKMDVYRASGAGGQHINKTSSAVRITHLPTGIVCASQEERSQVHNREKAMQMLKAKLYLLEQQATEKKLASIRGEVKENGWGSQIRSYVLHPYRMVKDLRTGEETGNTDAVLDGEIDEFLTAYLKWMQLGCPDRKVVGGE